MTGKILNIYLEISFTSEGFTDIICFIWQYLLFLNTWYTKLNTQF